MSIFTTITILSINLKSLTRCQMHIFLHKTEYNEVHPIIIVQVSSRTRIQYVQKNIVWKLSCTLFLILYVLFFAKYFVYCGFNNVVYYMVMKMICFTNMHVISLYH